MAKLTNQELTEDDIVIQFPVQKIPISVEDVLRIYCHKWKENVATGIVTAKISGYRWREIERNLKTLAAQASAPNH